MENLVIAKIIFCQVNESYMHKVYPSKCDSCGFPREQVINSDFVHHRHDFDVSITYDGYIIVSKRFMEFCILRNYKNVQFVNFPKEQDFFHLIVTQIVPIDYEKRNVKFLNFCNVCKNYAEVIGSTPSFIKHNVIIADDCFYRSEHAFGSFERKSPLLIINIPTANDLLKQKFKGLYLKDVYLS